MPTIDVGEKANKNEACAVANVLNNMLPLISDGNVAAIMRNAAMVLNNYTLNLAPDLNDDEKALLNPEPVDGLKPFANKIQAIKAYHERTGLFLRIAKQVVDNYVASMK